MRIKKILLILAAVTLYSFSVFFCHSAKEDASRTYLLLTDPIDAVRAEEIFDQEAVLADSVGFCFWGERENQWVSCKETGGIAEVTAILVSGNPGLLDAEALTWQEGCFLDEATAQAIFGTTACSWQSVWYRDSAYRVLDTVSAKKPTMLAAAQEADGLILNRCVLHTTVKTGKQTAQQFLLRWGLAGVTIGYYPLWVAVYDFLLIFPGILVAEIYFYGRNRAQSKGKKVILLLTVLCLLWLLVSRIQLLPDMLPSRWSDFSFWGRWWEDQRGNFQRIQRIPMGERPLQILRNLVKSILSATGAILLALWNVRRQNHADTAD